MTLKEIAKLAGVSIVTASRVMNDDPRVRKNLRERVLAVADENGYRPNLFARALVKSSTRFVALYINRLYNPFFGILAEKIISQLSACNYDGILCTEDDQHIHAFSSFSAIGSILVSRVESENLKQISRLCNHLVGINTYVPPGLNYPNIVFDFESSYIEIAKLLVAGGVKKVSFVTHVGERFQERKFAKLRVFLENSNCKIISPQNSGEFSSPEEFMNFVKIAQRRFYPDAIFCENDLIAIRLFSLLRANEVPEAKHIQIIGCDGTLFCKGVWTVAVDLDMTAKIAVELLIGQIEGKDTKKESVIIPTKVLLN